MCSGDILEHDQDTPCDGPLLTADQPATLARRSQLGDVDRHLGGANADTKAINDAADDQHADIHRRTHQYRADAPKHRPQQPGSPAANNETTALTREWLRS